MAKPLSYLALGDSYTIGEAVEPSESFPYQLVELLKAKAIQFENPKVIAKTGWTTDELRHAIQQEQITETFDLVTLLIGVNNQYRGYSQDTYRKEFTELLATAISFAGGDKNKVYVISIPDWGVTEFAKNSGRDLKTISKEIDAFNEINRQETEASHVTYVDITPISRQAVKKPNLIAGDGLHPSGKMYAEWTKLIAEKIIEKR
ncbi:SGNH/GDSL hydrolase family protein [Pedobacter sp. SL55]|uniref:SGNH/GDSL hydrolase family protein n=1 Tax=Pedobacter sp. SL55 TaxID=2995161 RepID=UPI00226D5E38|nr:SGNH/GDSL hydrolase family protein [Pedobacter sp. SL55]WAC41510.1 SGNH/GDSL hydrolase family protein [Pedobacter sp. SL55]